MYQLPESVTAISFDIWNTLLRGNRAFTRPRLKLIFNLLGQADPDVDALQLAYLRVDAYYDSLAELTGIDYGMGPRLQRMVDMLELKLVIPSESGIRAIQRQTGKLRLEPAYMPSLIEEDITNTLQQLCDRNLRLGLLSNTGMDNEEVMTAVLQKLDIWRYFSTAIFSSEDGRAKPNPFLFQHMTQLLEQPPDKVLHVGDNVVADGGASQAGLHVAIYGSTAPGRMYNIESMKELIST